MFFSVHYFHKKNSPNLSVSSEDVLRSLSNGKIERLNVVMRKVSNSICALKINKFVVPWGPKAQTLGEQFSYITSLTLIYNIVVLFDYHNHIIHQKNRWKVCKYRLKATQRTEIKSPISRTFRTPHQKSSQPHLDHCRICCLGETAGF